MKQSFCASVTEHCPWELWGLYIQKLKMFAYFVKKQEFPSKLHILNGPAIPFGIRIYPMEGLTLQTQS